MLFAYLFILNAMFLFFLPYDIETDIWHLWEQKHFLN